MIKHYLKKKSYTLLFDSLQTALSFHLALVSPHLPVRIKKIKMNYLANRNVTQINKLIFSV